MIKFRYAIHKETGIILTYDKWLQHFYECKNRGGGIELSKVLNRVSYDKDIDVSKSVFIYEVTDIFTTDDFEIIYESDFTREELDQLRKLSYTNESLEINRKIKKLLEREWKAELYLEY